MFDPVWETFLFCSVFGRFGFGGFGFGRQQEEEEEVRGEDIQMRIRASLKDFYVGRHITFTRVKGVYEKTSGMRQCNCRMKTVTKQLGPGMIQQFQQRVCLLIALSPLLWQHNCPANEIGTAGSLAGQYQQHCTSFCALQTSHVAYTCTSCGHLQLHAATDILTGSTMQECEQCPNVKLVEETVELSFDIEPGMDAGDIINLTEEGEPHADGDSGDLNIVMDSVPHPSFRREKHNLKIQARITLVDALVGFEREVEHLDGHKVMYNVDHNHPDP